MKYFFSILLSLLFLSSVSIASAVDIEGDISVTDTAFSGKGEISSFDISETGKILICANQAYSDNRYLMIFQQDGTLIKTLEFRTMYTIYARFSDAGEDNIILYEVRSSRAAVINMRGELLKEYNGNVEIEIAQISNEYSQCYNDIKYERNSGRTQITKYLDGKAEAFYEIKSAAPEFMVFWCCIMLFIVGASISLRAKLKKGLKQYKENESFPQEE